MMSSSYACIADTDTHDDPHTLTISPRPGGILRHSALVSAPVRGVACNDMNWHDYFTYNEKTDDLVWKKRPLELFPSKGIGSGGGNSWNSRFAGKVAGSKLTPSGKPIAILVRVNGVLVGAHRIVWEMHHGPIPNGMDIDHKNVNPFDNRLANLRLATMSENSRNRGANKNNKSGVKGVCLHKLTGLWMSQITIHRRKIHLGLHITKGLAAVSYAKAALRYRGKFTRIS